jgi:hypothetical protein
VSVCCVQVNAGGTSTGSCEAGWEGSVPGCGQTSTYYDDCAPSEEGPPPFTVDPSDPESLTQACH